MAAAAASTTATSATTTTTSTTYNSNITTSSANSQDSNKSPPKGVYKNLRLMHVSTIIVGCTVQLQTKDGSVFEGIFATFSPEFSICLDLAVQIDPKLKSQDCLFHALKNGSKAQEKAFFDLKDIVRITVNDVDLNSAIKEMDKVITDAEISGLNTSKPGERRELECWQDEDGDNSKDASLLSLEEVAISSKNGSQNNSRTGWDAQEMFRYNERKFNVNSTYDEDLHDYTIALPKSGKHDKDWRKKQDRAAAIAREIETNPQSQGRLAKEDGSDDEEEKFSAVVRPGIDAKHQQQQHHQSPSISSQQQQAQQPQHQQHQMPHAQPDSALSSTPPLSHQHQNQHQQPQSNQHQHLNQHQNPHHQQMNQHPRQIPNRLNNAAHKNLRPRYNHPRYESRLDSFKNFSRQLNIAPTPRQSQNQGNQMQSSPVGSQSQPSPQQSHQKQIRPQHQATQSQLQQQQQQQSPSQQQQHQSMPPKQQAPQQNQQPGPQQAQQPVSQQHPQSQLQQQQHLQPPQSQSQQTPQSIQQTPQSHPPQQATKTTPSVPTTTPASTVDTSTTSERSDTSISLSANQSKDQSELAKKSTLNPNAKEFVYKPRSPASIQGAQVNGSSQSAVGLGPSMDPTNSSPMSQAAHGAYYQQVPIFPHGLPPHQQQPHHPAQFMPNPHMHFQSQIHYMPTPMAPHFAPQQVSPRYIRGNFQNYHHRNGDHMNNVRATYPQTSMAVPTSASGQQFVPSPSGAQPHHMNTFAMGSPQQSIVYPHQSVYPMGPSNFHQPHMSHVPNPQTYEGYMPSTQNYVINQ